MKKRRVKKRRCHLATPMSSRKKSCKMMMSSRRKHRLDPAAANVSDLSESLYR